jgi:hypothetical protein
MHTETAWINLSGNVTFDVSTAMVQFVAFWVLHRRFGGDHAASVFRVKMGCDTI